VPGDYVEAVRWFRLAADQGDSNAQYTLGVMYSIGAGVPQDYVQAHMWLDLAAASTDSKKEQRDLAVQDRDRIASKMTPAQIAEAQKLASAWKPSQCDTAYGHINGCDPNWHRKF
jgi:uncharacterized protein